MAKENMNDQNEDDLESISTVEVNSPNLDQNSFLRQKQKWECRGKTENKSRHYGDNPKLYEQRLHALFRSV